MWAGYHIVNAKRDQIVYKQDIGHLGLICRHGWMKNDENILITCTICCALRDLQSFVLCVAIYVEWRMDLGRHGHVFATDTCHVAHHGMDMFDDKGRTCLCCIHKRSMVLVHDCKHVSLVTKRRRND